MSQGVPFISTDVGNARVLPGGVTISDVSEIHSAIDDLLGDYDKYKTLSLRGREFAFKNCRISAVVNKLNNIIENL